MLNKKRITLMIFIMCMAFFQIQTYALESNNVKDDLKYLNQNEINELQKLINETKNKHKLEIVIVITDKTNGKSLRAFANDYYDNNNYGVGINKSGLLMLINMDKRKVEISTTGNAIDIFNDKRIDSIVESLTSRLKKKEYYEACNVFIEKVNYYSNKGIEVGQYRKPDDSVTENEVTIKKSYFSKVLNLLSAWQVYLIALLVGIIPTIILSLSSKGKVTTSNRSYEEANSFKLNQSSDNFTHEQTTKTKIQKSSSSGSSTHKGSSGRSHGGGGGSF